MFRRTRFFIYISLALACLIAALVLTLGQIDRFNALRARFPAGSTIAGLPVGGLDAHAAGLHLLKVYAQTPVELRLENSTIHLDPLSLGQQLDLQKMLSAAKEQSNGSYWTDFWDFLWNRLSAPFDIPLACSVDGDQLREYLAAEISPRYNQPPTPANPVLGDVQFAPGQPGSQVDLESAAPQAGAALCSADQRVVQLTTAPVDPLPPSLDGMRYSLESLTRGSGFDGMIEVYFQDLTTGEEVSFAYSEGREAAPEIAFTGASTIKIPVMVSAYMRIQSQMPDDLRRSMELMIDLSDNSSTDEVMERVLDPNIAPIEVTRDMQAFGLQNTFLAGFFYPGAPLLDQIKTPANQRADLSTDPDIYNQTTAADMGRLLAAIEQCSASGGGPLVKAFNGEITQAECQEMTELMAKNRKGVLIEAGLPEGTRMAHKYGWVTDANDGLMHTASDAAIVYTPGGNFVLTIYLYHPDQLNWDAAQLLSARLATAGYNFYNSWK